MRGAELLAFLQGLSAIEGLAFGLFLAGTVAFFAWVAVLAARKER